jgi:branched-chain amino acid transport system permease protein
MGQSQLIKAFVVVVLGGMGNVVGTAFAAFFLGLVEMLAVVILPGGWRDLIAFAVLIAVLLVRPQGFASRRL